ncbi:amyloid-beta A4 precursor protein-binding family A member 3-like isoform X2 [Dunckerocampus dactyliophorus]|uniref:amyloid-beta A4 precursor protein-binding family A member 3-like isoform X2 n=1 Tax=Dunckerocampus dactyliophorus TaxID=161453 RepID=UPI002406BB1E|nr:amyloid-beta A4 precursor protein-binding family A member 3-like isoform X2 [Dunckerocampus dactyliophorus]
MDIGHSSADVSAPAISNIQRLTSVDGEPGNAELKCEVAADSQVESLDVYNPIEPPPLDWKSDSSTEAGSTEEPEDSSFFAAPGDVEEASSGGMHANCTVVSPDNNQQELNAPSNQVHELEVGDVEEDGDAHHETTCTDLEDDAVNRRQGDEDHTRIQALLSQLQLIGEEHHPRPRTSPCFDQQQHSGLSDLETCSSVSPLRDDSNETTGLLFSESHQRDVLGLLQCTAINASPHPSCLPHTGEVDAVVSVSYNQEDVQRFWGHYGNGQQQRHEDDSVTSLPDEDFPEPVWLKQGEDAPGEEATAAESAENADDHPSYKDVPGPCDPEDLLDGVIFGAKYLGSTQIKSERNPSTNARMAQAQEAVDRIKAPEGESQPMTEVDLFISTQRIKVISADTQEAMMDHALQMISYIADIGDIVVLMARRKRKEQETTAASSKAQKCLMVCHVFSSEDAQVIAQAIGQAFGVAYQQFLQVNGIKASDLRPGEYSDYLESQELYNGDLAHFSDSQNIRDVAITKAPGEILGLAVVESGWGSILPTVMVANLLHGGPAERCGELSIGDRIMSVNSTSMVGLPITTCQNIIRICSLMRGGIAERGGIRVGHRIIEINGQSVVATPHDKIIHILTNAVGEIHLKTMPASTYRLLTGQEQPVFL